MICPKKLGMYYQSLVLKQPDKQKPEFIMGFASYVSFLIVAYVMNVCFTMGIKYESFISDRFQSSIVSKTVL